MNRLTLPLAIGSVVLPGRATLAPMAGYTDCAVRALSSEGGAALTTTEMVSAKGLVYDGQRSASLLFTLRDGKPTCAQLFGHEPSFFYEAIKNAPYLDGFDIIDVNMGCPVKKIVSNGDGSALMREPLVAEKIVAACVSAAGGRPITVKMRLGYDEGEFVADEFARRMQGAGASAVTVHGRTKAMGYAGEADYGAIERVRSAVSIPVIGNGDIGEHNAATIGELFDGVAIGRAAMGDPWLFSRICGDEAAPTTREIMLRHIALMREHYGDRYAVVNMRKFVKRYLRGVRGAGETRTALLSAKDADELVCIIASADMSGSGSDMKGNNDEDGSGA